MAYTGYLYMYLIILANLKIFFAEFWNILGVGLAWSQKLKYVISVYGDKTLALPGVDEFLDYPNYCLLTWTIVCAIISQRSVCSV